MIAMKRMVAVGIVMLLVDICLFLAIASPSPIAKAERNIIIVDNEGDGDYTTIKEALNNANPGDTIEVYSGTYYEHNITIEMEDITLKGMPYELGSGNDTGKPFIDGEGKEEVISVMAEGITVTGFHIENEGAHAHIIIGISGNAHNCEISDNDISHSIMACIGVGSNNNKILNNNISHSVMRQGIVVGNGSSNNIISGNTISDMDLEGILLWNSHHNLVSYNRVSRCSWVGITIIGDRNIIYRNHIEDNDNGLEIWNGIFNFVIQNNFINNSYDANCALGWGFYPGFSNRWINNHWDDWIGFGPKVIPGTILLFIPRPNFDWRPAREPYDIQNI